MSNDTAAPGGHAVAVLSLLVLARVCLGYQFQAAGSVAPFVAAELGFSQAQVGTIIGLFMAPGLIVCVLYAALNRIGSGDKVRAIVALGLTGAGALMAGFSTSFAGIGAGRAISGAAAAFLLIALNKMMADQFAGKRLFLPMSLFIVGWPLGIAAAQVSQPSMAAASGWPSVFLAAAVLQGVCALGFVLLYRDPMASATSLSIKPAWPTARETLQISAAGIVWMLINAAYILLLSFGPAFVLEQGATVTQASQTVSLMSWIALIAIPLGGYMAGRLQLPTGIMVLSLAVSLVVVGLLAQADASALNFALFGFAFALATPIVATLPAEILRPESRGAGLSLFYGWFYAGSAALPMVAGTVADRSGSAQPAIVLAAVLVLTSLCIISVWRWRNLAQELSKALTVVVTFRATG